MADSLFQSGKYSEALQYYDLALKKDVFFQAEINYYSAYCFFMLKKDSLAFVKLSQSFDSGYRYQSKEELESDWLLAKMGKNQGFKSRYDDIIRMNTTFIGYFNPPMHPEIADSLKKCVVLDQKYRIVGVKNDSIWKFQKTIDRTNQKYVSDILEQFNGFPDIEAIGEEAVHNMLLIAIHSNDKRFVKKVIQYAEKALYHNRIDPSDYALLRDKYCLMLRKKQLFGTQVYRNEGTNAIEIKPIDNALFPFIESVRHCFKLVPLDEYLNDMKTINAN